MTAKRLKRPRDPVELGKLIGDILTGQVEDRATPSKADEAKDQAAVALGRKGGLKGGRARAAFSEYMDRTLVNLKSRRIQVDEVWGFSYCKQKNVAGAKKAPQGAGDIWTWVGLDADTKLAASFYVGNRDGEAALEFMTDLKGRLANRIQLTSDGHSAYLNAVEETFGAEIDYAQLVKIYGEAPEGQRRYSPAVCTGAIGKRIEGRPDARHVSTSFVERQNLNIRMGNRRMTRLTNAFSKKAENHAHMMAIYFMHYNFVRIHQTLKISPAMAAGVSSKLWEMSDMVRVLEEWEGTST